ncbi:hypothetical protein LR48_Vigan06g111200 [Vigna angularis]|uniref:Uncharacterized protein n=1 Tax=Phaseolus angularis TaxID=3914 RepID=A0A0L9USV4_PHAAN|nr:hypothetical protein LR48_Vigan06g111200 [Vigna angularis]
MLPQIGRCRRLQAAQHRRSHAMMFCRSVNQCSADCSANPSVDRSVQVFSCTKSLSFGSVMLGHSVQALAHRSIVTWADRSVL